MIKKLSNNIRLYPVYCLFGWDLLFYYSIATLFLVTIKEISVSQIVLIDSIAALAVVVFQIPVRIIASRFTNPKNIQIGLFCWIISMLLIMISPNIMFIVVGRMFFSLGSCFKANSEVSILHEPLNKLRKPNWFTIVFGKGLSSYMYVNAVGAVFAGILFSINPYIPMAITIICLTIAFATALKFEETAKLKKKLTVFESIYELKKGIKHIGSSRRLKMLFLYTLSYFSIIGITTSYVGVYLNESNINPIVFSLIYTVLSLTQGICSKLEYKIENKFKKKTLTVFSITHVVTFILVGLVGIITRNIFIVVVLFVVQYGLAILDRVARNKYITNFTSSGIRESILSINSTIEYFSKFIGLLFASYLLKHFNINISYLILGVLYLIVMLIVTKTMRNKLGLMPEQYSINERLYDPYK